MRFSAYGFGVATPAGASMPTVYVHYVDPRGKLRRTISLGAGTTPCGTIVQTTLRRLFPFNPRRGRWTLQFDTSRTYRRATGVSRLRGRPGDADRQLTRDRLAVVGGPQREVAVGRRLDDDGLSLGERAVEDRAARAGRRAASG